MKLISNELQELSSLDMRQVRGGGNAVRITDRHTVNILKGGYTLYNHHQNHPKSIPMVWQQGSQKLQQQFSNYGFGKRG